jgi:hypothetical protein
MNLQTKIAFEGDLKGFADRVNKDISQGARAAVERMAQRTKFAFRNDIRQAGLGERLANTWQSKTYPAPGKQTLHPASWVYSKAPVIVSAFSEATTITPKNGVALAIPTENVPHRGNRRLTPLEVEGQFNQDLILRPSPRNHLNTLAFVNVVAAKNGRGFRSATKGRTRQGRKPQLVLMFIFVRQVHLQKRLNIDVLAASLESEWASMLGDEVNKALQ